MVRHLTGCDEAVLVLIRRVADPGPGLDPWPGLVVVPVTFDTASAHRGTVVLDAEASPLGVPVAIHEDLTATLPRGVLRRRVVPTRAVDLAALTGSGPGWGRGRPLEGPADPRHEVRQHVADRLTAVSPLVDVELAPAGAALAGDGFGPVVEQLQRLQECGTTVEPFATPAGCPEGWVGLGRVLDRHLSLLVIGTPAGLITDADHVAARGVAVRWHASALIVCPRHGATVDLYTPKGLYEALQVPLGRRAPEPSVSGLDLVDSIRKFLDLHPLWHVPDGSGSRPVRRIDVHEVLDRQVRAAAADLAGRRVRGAGKPEAYGRASTRGEQLAAVLQRALDGTLDPQDVPAVVDRQAE